METVANIIPFSVKESCSFQELFFWCHMLTLLVLLLGLMTAFDTLYGSVYFIMPSQLNHASSLWVAEDTVLVA